MKKLVIALTALALAAVLGFSLGRGHPPPPPEVAWAQKFIKDPTAVGKGVLGGVELEGILAVDGLLEACEVEQERDPDTGQLKKRPGRVKYSNISLSYRIDKSTPILMRQWIEDTASGAVLERKSGAVIITDRETGREIQRYNFFEGWPCKWHVPDLDSDSSGMAMEKIEIAVEKVERAK